MSSQVLTPGNGVDRVVPDGGSGSYQASFRAQGQSICRRRKAGAHALRLARRSGDPGLVRRGWLRCCQPCGPHFLPCDVGEASVPGLGRVHVDFRCGAYLMAHLCAPLLPWQTRPSLAGLRPLWAVLRLELTALPACALLCLRRRDSAGHRSRCMGRGSQANEQHEHPDLGTEVGQLCPQSCMCMSVCV